MNAAKMAWVAHAVGTTGNAVVLAGLICLLPPGYGRLVGGVDDVALQAAPAGVDAGETPDIAPAAVPAAHAAPAAPAADAGAGSAASNTHRLASSFEKMSPETAAKVLLLLQSKDAGSALALLEALSAEHAAGILDRIAASSPEAAADLSLAMLSRHSG